MASKKGYTTIKKRGTAMKKGDTYICFLFILIISKIWLYYIKIL